MSPFIKYIRLYHKQVKYDITAEYPSLRYEDKVFHGFFTTGKELKTFNSMKKFLPADFPGTHYRLMRDFITRYIYPHMIPTVKPPYPAYFLSGFHGQHKEAIDNIKNESLRNELRDVFTINHEDVIINGGAYLGFGDMGISQMNPDGTIIAVEAEKQCFEMLKLNLSENKITNVVPLNNALWNQKGTMELETTDFQANSLIEQIVEGQDKQIIECTTIDEIVRANSLKKVDFISLTINGAEVEAIDGMKETLSQYKPRMRLAGWYNRDGKPVWKHVSEKLKRFDYKVIVGKRGGVLAYKK